MRWLHGASKREYTSSCVSPDASHEFARHALEWLELALRPHCCICSRSWRGSGGGGSSSSSSSSSSSRRGSSKLAVVVVVVAAVVRGSSSTSRTNRSRSISSIGVVQWQSSPPSTSSSSWASSSLWAGGAMLMILTSMTARKAEAAYTSCRAIANESFVERFNRMAVDGLPYPQTQTPGPQLDTPPALREFRP